MLDGGLRRGEAHGLHLDDISYGHRRVTIWRSPCDAACAPNTLSGSLTLLSNLGGLAAVGNHVAGAVTATGNSWPGPYPGDPSPVVSGNGH
jgi:hypothetical protein